MTHGSEAFWLLTEPFDERSDARFLVPTRPVRAALTRLQETLVSRPGWVVVAGQRGVGKSVLATLFLESLEDAHPFAVVPDAGVPPADVRAEIDEQLGEAGRPPTQDALLRANRAGRRPVVVLDGAETLGEGTVRELERAFAAPGGSTTGRLLVDFVAVLERAPGAPPPAWARERGVSVIVQEPLDARDTAEYVRRRVRLAAGGERELFDEGALDEVFRRTGGLPEGINRVCALALDRVAAAGGSHVGAEDVRDAAERLGDLPPVIHAAIDRASADDAPSPPPAAAGPAASRPAQPSTSARAASTPEPPPAHEPPPAPARTPERPRPVPTRAADRTARERDVEPRPGTSPWVVLGAALAGSVVGGLLVLWVTGQGGVGALPDVATPPPLAAPLDAHAAPSADGAATAPPAGAASEPERPARTTRSTDEDGAPGDEPEPTVAEAAEAAAAPTAPSATPSAPEAAPDATAAGDTPAGEPFAAPPGADAMPSSELESLARVAPVETAEPAARPAELAAVSAAPPLEPPAPPAPPPPRVGLPLRDAAPILERALAGRVPAGAAFTVRFYGGRADATDVVERGEIAWAELDGRLSTLAVLEGQGARRPAHLLDREGARAPGSVRVFFPDERVVRTAEDDDPFAGTGFRYTDFLPLRAADFEIDAFEGDLLEGQPVFVVTARLRYEPATGLIELVIGERDGRLLEWRAFQAPGGTPVRRVVMPRDTGTPGSQEWRVYDAGGGLVARARIDSAPLADDLDPDLFTFSRLNDPDFTIPRR